jgi:hypothetical protein
VLHIATRLLYICNEQQLFNIIGKINFKKKQYCKTQQHPSFFSFYQKYKEDPKVEYRTRKLNLWDRFLAAITFAEAGEAETAIEMLNKEHKEKRPEARVRKSEQRPELRV